MGDDFPAGTQGVFDFLRHHAAVVDIRQRGCLVGLGDVVNALALGIGFLQRFHRRDGFAGVLVVDEHLLRHGVFQSGRNQPDLEQVVAFFGRVVAVVAGDVNDGDIHGGPAGCDGARDAVEIADVGFIAVGAVASRQVVVAVLLEAQFVGSNRQ